MAVPASARDSVLDAAAQLFDAQGYAAVSIGDLVAASGVSNGSIYHHFGSKDGVLSALVVGALSDYQRLLVAVLEGNDGDLEAGIRAAVAHELRWLETNPRQARLIVAHRDAVATSVSGREPLRVANRAFMKTVRGWLDRHEVTRELDINVLHAVVFAPARELGSLWLAKRIKEKPTSFAEVLGDGAWAALGAVVPAPVKRAETEREGTSR